MARKTPTQVGNPLIRAHAKRVTNPQSKAVQRVIKDLIDSMHHHHLVGMASPQIGKSMRIFVTEIRRTKLRKNQSIKNTDPLRVFINPKIIKSSKKQAIGWEGCGSVASSNLFGMVKRPKSILIEALDQKGNIFQLKADNLLARVIQHEFDHLNGIIFTDKADPKTYMSRSEYLKAFSRKK